MKSKFVVFVVACAAIGLGLGAAVSQSAPGGTSGPPDGKGPGAEEAGNNLSYPAVYADGVPDTFIWSMPASPALGVNFSFGCDQPETVDQFSYPNTSCVDSADNALTPEECTDGIPPSPCAGFAPAELSQIYWQKVEANQWNADTVALASPVTAKYLDWADNLESNTWSTRSVVRVETQPFAYLLDGEGLEILQRGFQMWHVSGHGPDEHWGVRAESQLAPYIYESPYAIIHTGNARLNIAKLERATDICPSPGTGEVGVPPVLDLSWVADTERPGEMKWVSNTAAPDPCKLRDIDYTVELNVGGKWVYGYNWMTKKDALECTGFLKAGWYRLTFYTENGEVLFDPLDPVLDTTPAPTFTAVPTVVVAAEESETEDTMYSPVIDYDNNLTYIDICLVAKTQGGGGGGGSKGRGSTGGGGSSGGGGSGSGGGSGGGGRR